MQGREWRMLGRYTRWGLSFGMPCECALVRIAELRVPKYDFARVPISNMHVHIMILRFHWRTSVSLDRNLGTSVIRLLRLQLWELCRRGTDRGVIVLMASWGTDRLSAVVLVCSPRDWVIWEISWINHFKYVNDLWHYDDCGSFHINIERNTKNSRAETWDWGRVSTMREWQDDFWNKLCFVQILTNVRVDWGASVPNANAKTLGARSSAIALAGFCTFRSMIHA